MERSYFTRRLQVAITLFAVATLVTASGCGRLLATMVYVWNGGNFVPAEYEGLVAKRVVVVCQPPSSLSFQHPHADRDVARRVANLIATNVEDVDIVDPKEVDNWADEDDLENFRELAKSVDAQRVVLIDLEQFSLNKGPTLYQGNAIVHLSVYDMEQDEKVIWEKSLGEILFPTSGVPIADKTPEQFRRQYLTILSEQIARHFYEHDPYFDFAMDATAHR